MGLRDLFKREAREAEDDGTSSVAEPVLFTPRIGSLYRAGSTWLRFGPGPRVREADAEDPDAADKALSGGTGRTGEWTSSGRFSVQAPFERAIVYTVLETTPDSFTARRTDAGSRETVTVMFAAFGGTPSDTRWTDRASETDGIGGASETDRTGTTGTTGASGTDAT